MRAFRVRGRLNQDISKDFKLNHWLGKIQCDGIGFTGARSVGEMVVHPRRKNHLCLDLDAGILALYAVKDEQSYLLADHSFHADITTPLPNGKYQLRIIGKDALFHLVVSKKFRFFKD